jgi:hypothetical protein
MNTNFNHRRDSKKDNLKSSADNYDEQLDQLMCNMIRSSNETQKAIRERSQTTGRQTPEPSSTPERSRTPERSSKGRRSSISYGTPTNSPKGPLESLAYRLTRIIRDSARSESNSRRSSCENSTAEDFSTSEAPEQQRNIKLSSSFNCDTTSSKSTKEIKKKIISAAQKCSLHCDKVSRYEFKITMLDNDEDQPSLEKIVFDIEIVKMKDFKNLKGLKFKRLEGDIWAYKTIATNLLAALNL